MDSAHNEFVAGQTYTDTLTVKSADGTEHTLTVNILGTNDAAVIGGATTTAVTEGDTAAAISTSGQLTISDVDSAATFVAQRTLPVAMATASSRSAPTARGPTRRTRLTTSSSRARPTQTQSRWRRRTAPRRLSR